MIGSGLLHLLIGCFLGAVALWNGLDATNPKRGTSALFWGLLSLLVMGGDHLPRALVGGLVVGLALLAGLGLVRGGASPATPVEARRASAERLGGRLLIPALMIPLCTVLLTLLLKRLPGGGQALVAPAQATLVALALGCLAALGTATVLTRAPLAAGPREGRRLLDAIGWAALLPLLLATLGAVFTASGVGDALAFLLQKGLPVHHRWVALLAYGLGMTLLTALMGNAFAAFPVIMGGLGIPVLVGMHGANPAPLAAIGMLTGYCGTLLSPMAANFNLVPAALLELDDPHAVIKVQAPTALGLWAANMLVMALLVFR